MAENRKSDRFNSMNLSYILLNEADQVVHQGMGRTLNLSVKGVFLETSFPIESKHSILITIGLADDMIEVKGNVAHFRKLANGRYGTGITFNDVSEREGEILHKFFKTYFDYFITSKPGE